MNAPIHSLLKDAKFSVSELAAAAATTDLTGEFFDMTGFEAITFVLNTGTLTDTGTISLDVYENTAASTSGAVAITASSTTALTGASNNGDGKLFIAERIRPTKRYVYAVINRGTANCVVNSCIAIQYGAANTPVTQGSDVAASASSAGN